MERLIGQVLRKELFKGKTILVFGPRRVGKTYLAKELVKEYDGVYHTAEWIEVREKLSTVSQSAFREFVGNAKFIIIDEAQGIPEIGIKLKLLHDTFPDVQFMITGSSSLELAHKTAEPLTGRSRYYTLYPVSYNEMRLAKSPFEAYAGIESYLRFGMYPEITLKPESERIDELRNIVSTYLYRDVLEYGQLKRPDIVEEILKLLAFQIGHEVSLNEISNKTNTTVKTVARYLAILEQAFVIKSLHSYNRNLRNEIGKSRKYYFVDLGIRNTIINNFNPLTLRNDVGQLWENFCVMERIKKNEYARRYVNIYFWRTYDQKEIDYLEEIDGNLNAFEFKWDLRTTKPPKTFLDAYPGSTYQVIAKENLQEFI